MKYENMLRFNLSYGSTHDRKIILSNNPSAWEGGKPNISYLST